MMDEIEVVIRIPKEIYNHTQEYEVGGFNQINNAKIFNAIKNGTVLPKGHGKLLDSNILWDAFQVGQDFYEAFVFAEANAVIEADKDGDAQMADRDCENCYHYMPYEHNGEIFYACTAWNCHFEPKESADENI